MEPYRDSIEHLRDELLRLDLLLRRALVLARGNEGALQDDLRGLVISESEIDVLVGSGDFFGGRWRLEEKCREELGPIDDELAFLRDRIDQRRGLTRGPLALPALARRFELSSAEVDLLLVALAPQLEPRYETVYAYLQDDVTRKRPSVDLALNLICRAPREKLAARQLFAPFSRLVHGRLIELVEDPQDRRPCLLRKFLRTTEPVLGFLLGEPPAPAVGTLIQAAEEEAVEAATRERLSNLAAAVHDGKAEGFAVRLVGGAGAPLPAAAALLAAELGCALLHADLEELGDDEDRLAGLMRDAVLWNALAAVSSLEPPASNDEGQRLKRAEAGLWKAFQGQPGPLLLLGPASAFPRPPDDARLWRLEVESPGFDLRHNAWRSAMNGHGNEADTARLADAFHFSGGRIRQALEMASGYAALRDPTADGPSVDDLMTAGRVLTAPNVERFALRVEPRYTWPDIVLPDKRAAQLRGIAERVKLRRMVHCEWGFAEKLSRGKGFNILFTGPSGTGKTMAAEVLASDLCLDLFQIDLASVVSKYIGETEKHLASIFREAEQGQALLFFDEADALFGKRTEVKDAHDRYANIEVNYLLQRIEQYEGLVVLATNMQRNLDDAFLRRMQEVVEFPFPDESARERIWDRHFPPRAPRADDLDLAFLAKSFQLTGGSIKNVVLGAAFLAARDSRPIAMGHLIRAVGGELQKQGKLCVKSDFGPYYQLLEGGPLEGPLEGESP